VAKLQTHLLMWTVSKKLGIEFCRQWQAKSISSFMKKEEAVTMSTKPAVKIRGEQVSVDPQLLFQCLHHNWLMRDRQSNEYWVRSHLWYY
jgi:hypothetical protein